MAASANDKLKKVKGFFSTTLSAQKNNGAGSMSLSDATGIPTTTGLVFTVGRVDSNGTATPSTRAIYKGTLSGTTVSNLTLTEGTDQTHAAGTVVEITFTETHWNDAVDAILNHSNQSGDIEATNTATFNSNIDINDSTTAIRDTSDNEFLKFSKTASAVNEVTVANAATGSGPTLSATGGDTNIDFNVVTKGTGKFKVGGNPIDHGAWTAYTPTFTNTTLGNGSVAGAYTQIGKTVHFRAVFTLGSTSAMSSNPTVTLPVTSATTAGSMNVFISDTGTAFYGGYTAYVNTTTLQIYVFNTGTPYARLDGPSSTIPHTWGNTDILTVSGTYEAA